MIPEVIRKTKGGAPVAPNLPDYEEARARFSWERAAAGLSGLPGRGGLNIAYEAVDRHAAGSRANHLALRWLGQNGATRDISYRELAERTGRFANVLASLGVGPGQRVFVLAGRVPELMNRDRKSVV